MLSQADVPVALAVALAFCSVSLPRSPALRHMPSQVHALLRDEPTMRLLQSDPVLMRMLALKLLIKRHPVASVRIQRQAGRLAGAVTG